MRQLWISLSLLLSLSTLTSSQSNGDVRLVGGHNSYEGRLEIFLKGKWGTFCGVDNTKFTSGAAEAACKQLGYNDQIEYGSINKLKFPKASSDMPIHIGLADCDYRFAVGQLHILRCNISEEVHSECSQDTAIGVKCEHVSRWIPSQTYNTAVKLSNATEYTSSGVLEIYLNNIWGNVCGSGGSSTRFDQHAADSACRQLGYTNAASYRTNSQSSQSTVWLDGVTCGGTTSCNCLNRCFSSIPSSPFTQCSGVDSFVHIECTFDLSLKDSATSGNIQLCGESTEGKCSGPGGGGGEVSHHISGGALAGIIIGVCFLGCLLVSIVCLTATLFIPNCPLNKLKRQTYKSLHTTSVSY